MLIVIANPRLGPEYRAVIDEVALPGFAPKGWKSLGPWCGKAGTTLTDAEWAAQQTPTVAPPKKQPTSRKRVS